MPKQSEQEQVEQEKSKADRAVATEIREEVLAYLKKNDYKDISGKDAIDRTFQRDEGFYYIVTPANVILYAGKTVGKGKKVRELNFERWATVGYTANDVDLVLGDIPISNNMKLVEKGVDPDEQAAKIEAENAEIDFRNKGVSGGYAFTEGGFYQDICRLCDDAEMNMKSITKGEACAKKLNEIRIILISGMRKKPENPKQTELPVKED